MIPAIRTPLSERVGLRYPIVAAPMFLVSNLEMIVASARAGILGTIPSLNFREVDDFRAALKAIRAATDGPFGVNVPLKLVDPARAIADISLCIEYEVPVIITSLGDPSPVVGPAHERGLHVFHDVIGLRHAIKADKAGVDAIIGVSAGAGGHAGTISPFVLVPYLKQHVKAPIVAAGCIAGGQQMAAALALGAELVYMGTRFIACEESAASVAYKKMCVGGHPDDVVYTNEISGIHGNFLRSTVPDPNDPPGRSAKRWKDIWSAGQGISVAHEIKSIAGIVDDIVQEYEAAVSGLPRVG